MLNKIIVSWLPFAALSIIFSGLAYSIVQHDLRISANDPQIQMAEDAARQLSDGANPLSALNTLNPIDIATSLAPYIIIFDASGNTIVSSAKLDGKTPVPPAGVFEYAQKYGQDRLTWQPKPEVRIAAILMPYKNKTSGDSGFVLAGRSLREIEKRENDTFLMASLSGIISLAATFAFAGYIAIQKEKNKSA